MSNLATGKIMSAREWGMLIALSVLWGGSFFFVGIAVKALPPFTIVALRVTLAAAALVLSSVFLAYRCRAAVTYGWPFSAWDCSTTSFPSR